LLEKTLDALCLLITLFFEEESQGSIRWFNIKRKKNFNYDENFIHFDNGAYLIFLSKTVVGKFATFIESLKIFYKYVSLKNHFNIIVKNISKFKNFWEGIFLSYS